MSNATKTKRIDPTKLAAEYLMSRGASRWHAWTVAGKIEDASAGNRHFATGYRNPRCTIKNGFVERYAVTVDVHEPDAGRITECRIIYKVTFGKRGATSRVKIKAA